MKPNSFTRSGILLLDKPAGLTSHDVVSRTRKFAGTRKVGHAGTLDPMATGLLVLGLNSSTRLLTFLVGLDKTYFATIRLGRATDTDDADGEAISTVDASSVSDDAIRAALESFVGDISQVPSSVSAIKVDGRRAYDLVRQGETVELSARAVTVSAIELFDIRRVGEFLDLDVRVDCSSGTYIRAIARDLGAALAVGGHLTALRRSSVGPFDVVDAAPLDETLTEHLMAPADVAALLFPTRELDAQEAIDLSQGKRIPAGSVAGESGPIAAVAPSGALVGLVGVTGSRLRPIVNFPTDEAVGPAVEPAAEPVVEPALESAVGPEMPA
jgi:tRNA pseudouridine55 synthase